MQPWPADQYAIGAYIQHHFSDRVLSDRHFQFRNNDILLDLGCGDGSYTAELVKKIPDGRVVGWDPDEKMIALALQRSTAQLTFECRDAETLTATDEYSVITAFWSLQWIADAEDVLRRVHHALKPGGRFFAVLPSAHCLHFRLFTMLRDSGRFPCLEDFEPSVRFPTLDSLQKQGKLLGFKSFYAKMHHHKLKLPDLDTFAKFINGIPFFNGGVPDREIPVLNAAMVEAFQSVCQQEFAGELFFSDEMIVLSGMKSPKVIELSPEQRELLMKKQEPRGDLDTPRSQVKDALGDGAHFDSTIKPHEKFMHQPMGDDRHLSQQTANNPVADQRAQQAPEYVPVPTAKLQAQLTQAPQNAPKPVPGK